jgi:hypothetical protein
VTYLAKEGALMGRVTDFDKIGLSVFASLIIHGSAEYVCGWSSV